MKPIQIGPGIARRTDGISRDYVYEEAGRVFRGFYEGRETGNALIVVAHVWDEPQGLRITEEERQRIYDAFWTLGGVGYILVPVTEFNHFVPVRWNREEKGFLLKIQSTFDYMELGHVLTLDTEEVYDREANRTTQTVYLPAGLRWYWPDKEPISEDRRRIVVTRILSAKTEDVWNGTLTNTEIVLQTV